VAKAAAPKIDNKIQWDQNWERFTGRYSIRNRPSQVLIMNEKLVIINPHATSIDSPIELEPLGNDLFKMKAPTAGRPVGEVVRFTEQNGVVTRMLTGDTYFERRQD
jgi:hypothetical protein